jgi:hypothetical protein
VAALGSVPFALRNVAAVGPVDASDCDALRNEDLIAEETRLRELSVLQAEKLSIISMKSGRRRKKKEHPTTGGAMLNHSDFLQRKTDDATAIVEANFKSLARARKNVDDAAAKVKAGLAKADAGAQKKAQKEAEVALGVTAVLEKLAMSVVQVGIATTGPEIGIDFLTVAQLKLYIQHKLGLRTFAKISKPDLIKMAHENYNTPPVI